MTGLNETHDPNLRSWVESANDGQSDFPIQNLPFAIFRRRDSQESWRGGVAIGDQIVDMAAAVKAGIFAGDALMPAQAACDSSLNHLMGLGRQASSALRLTLSRALATGATSLQAILQACLIPQADAEYALPAQIGDYTDFYTSIHHATNVGRLFRPDSPLMPNYKWVPIGYHGRASSIEVSPHPFQRPCGQVKPVNADAPHLQASARLDIELELGIFIGRGNDLGKPVDIEQAEDHIFGLVLFNDWSARDIQPWEYQPLGPFLAKNFASTVSPWVVTLEALAPFRAPFTRPEDDPAPLPYLDSPGNRTAGGLNIELEALIRTPAMQRDGADPARLARSNYHYAYWTAGQLVAHHTVSGCNLRAGDLFGTGTLSGPGAEQACALLELTAGGKNPIELPNGEQRTWLEDGDTVTLRGWCEKPGAVRIGFGECVGTVLPARPL